MTMNILVVGASGYVGRAAARAMTQAGHSVMGLARSEAAAERIAAQGAEPIFGDLDDLAVLLSSLAKADAVVFAPQLDRPSERRVVAALLDAMSGTGKRFVMCSGTAVLSKHTPGGEWTEDNFAEDDRIEGLEDNERVQTEMLVRAAAHRGVVAMVVRPPMIWGHGRCPPLAALHSSARTGAICYFGRGLNVCSNIHVDDLADIFLLAIQNGVPGALYHAVSGEMNWRSLAERIGVLRGLPTRSVNFEEANRLYGPFLAPIAFGTNMRTRCPRTRNELGWAPHPDRLDLFEELGHPAFMAIPATDGQPMDFTLGEALQKGRSEG